MLVLACSLASLEFVLSFYSIEYLLNFLFLCIMIQVSHPYNTDGIMHFSSSSNVISGLIFRNTIFCNTIMLLVISTAFLVSSCIWFIKLPFNMVYNFTKEGIILYIIVTLFHITYLPLIMAICFTAIYNH